MSKPSLNDTAAYLTYLENLVSLNKSGTDTAWVANCTYLIFFMQAGFCLLEAGATRHKNHTSTLVKNMIDMAVSTIAWWLLGYGFAFGTTKEGVIGTSFFAGDGVEKYDQYNNWMFQWAFAGTAATIVSGCVLERITLWGYVLYSSFMTAWIYPIIVHWAWHEKGWLKAIGYLDFAGSGVVHMVGGVAGFAATTFLKPRIGRFPKENEEKNEKEFKPNYVPFVVLGTFILWFCWYGFNCGSTFTIVGEESTRLVGKIGMNTGISACSAGLTCFTIVYFLNKNTDEEYSICALCNGLLAGLVGVTASCNVVTSWAAFCIGIISGLIYLGYSKLLVLLKIDDPLDASPIHMGCGSWGVIAVGWFDPSKGVLYGHGGHLFGVQLCGVVVIFAWTATCTIAFFFLLYLCKLHRIKPEEELAGLDMKCGGLIHQYDMVSAAQYGKVLSGVTQPVVTTTTQNVPILENNNVEPRESLRIKKDSEQIELHPI